MLEIISAAILACGGSSLVAATGCRFHSRHVFSRSTKAAQ